MLSRGDAGTINLNSGGTLRIGVGGTTGVLGVTTLTNNGTLIFNRSDASTFTGVIGGTSTVLKQGGGTLSLVQDPGYLGYNLDAGQVLGVQAGTVEIVAGTGSLTVGSTGTGTLVVSGGTLVNAGSQGVGTLDIASGNVTAANAIVGYNAGSFGTATISGGTWAMSDSLSVGFLGTGTLDLDGGSVVSSYGYLGDGAGSVGSATVSGGTLAISSNLNVGNEGTGTLLVDGGAVTGFQGILGGAAGGLGTVSVASGTWSMSGGLVVGLLGTGSLGVTGGHVASASSVIGYLAGSVGAATITGGTWATNQDLSVGSDGAGTLTIADGGSVVVGSTCFRGSAGTINLNPGGTLQIGTGGTRGWLDVPTLTNNGTLIFNRSDASTYAGIISGSGTIVKQGAGALTLAGANSSTGLTTLAGGMLALSGSGSIGTGGLNLGTTADPGTFDLAALTAGTYSLPATGDLAGVGTLSGNGKSLAVLRAFTPGNSAGTITVGTGLSLDLSLSGSSVFEITSPAFTAGTFDLVNGDGSVIFGGILNLAFSGGTYADGTDVLQIFANSGGRSGNFSAVNYTGLAAGQSATFNAATGFITVVPEPSTYAISTIATAGLAGLMRWRKRRSFKSTV
jgi:T5SS/PEP-CTERM-associated repeat protein/autotransporter-associated beta strand protein